MSIIFSKGSGQARPVRRTYSGAMVCVGDSITDYFNASDPDHAVTRLLASRLGVTEINLGHPGFTMIPSVAHSPGSFADILPDVPAYDSDVHALLRLALGMNDWGRTGGYPLEFNAAAYSSAASAAIDSLIAIGWPVERIFFVSPSYPTNTAFVVYTVFGAPPTRQVMLDIIEAGRLVAEAKGTLYYPDYFVMEDNNPGSLIDPSDGVHPIDTGHLLMAESEFNYLIG